MKTIRLDFWVSLGLCLLCLSGAFLTLGGWNQAAIGLAVGVLWGILGWKGYRVHFACFLILMALLAWGAGGGLPAGWLLASMVLLLAAWDLGEYMSHLASFEADQISPQFIRLHLKRLLAVSGAGFWLGGAALVIQVRLGFETALLLGLFVFFGLAGMVRYLRRGL
jgi:hypothetical protein